MSLTLNKDAYEKLIKEDLEWLKKNTINSLERDHIISVLNDSIKVSNHTKGENIGHYKKMWENIKKYITSEIKYMKNSEYRKDKEHEKIRAFEKILQKMQEEGVK